MKTNTVLKIDEINDLFRLSKHSGLMEPEAVAKFPKDFPKGRVYLAGGLAQASREKQMAAVQGATNPGQKFTKKNDPYGEHDFGAATVVGSSSFEEFKIFWKIDYYSDAEMEYGAEDPASESTYRVLTVMFAEDY